MPDELREQLERDAGVPVFNGLASDRQPLRALADLLQMQQRSGKPLAELRIGIVGDAQTPRRDALRELAARVGATVGTGPPWPGRVDFVVDSGDMLRSCSADTCERCDAEHCRRSALRAAGAADAGNVLIAGTARGARTGDTRRLGASAPEAEASRREH